MASFRILPVVIAVLLAAVVVVQARYLPTRADDTNVRAIRHILSEILHQSGRPSYLSHPGQAEANESEFLASSDDSLYQ